MGAVDAGLPRRLSTGKSSVVHSLAAASIGLGYSYPIRGDPMRLAPYYNTAYSRWQPMPATVRCRADAGS